MTREQQMQDMMTAAFWRDIEEGNQPDNGDAIEIAKTYERAYQQGWRDADQHPHWIPVEEELPKHDVEENGLITYPSVLVCLYDGFRDESYYDDIRGEWGDYDGEVEYWMPMPAVPTKEGGQEDAS